MPRRSAYRRRAWADVKDEVARTLVETTVPLAGDLTTHAALTTAAHGGIVADTDARLSDARPVSGIWGGGSRVDGVRSASYVPVKDYPPLVLDATVLAGKTVKAYCDVRTENALTSVTPRIREYTTGVDAVVGVACTATDPEYAGANQRQVLTLTLTAGANRYRAELIGGNADADIFNIVAYEVSL